MSQSAECAEGRVCTSVWCAEPIVQSCPVLSSGAIVQCPECRVCRVCTNAESAESRAWTAECRLQSAVYRVQSAECIVCSVECRVHLVLLALVDTTGTS